MKHGLCKIMLVALVLLCGSARAMADDVVWTNVSTVSQFKDAINNNTTSGVCTANIQLEADIDLSQLDSAKYYFNVTFSGKISGKRSDGSTETNYKLMNGKQTLFNTLKGAELSDLVVIDCSYPGKDEESGVLADFCDGSTLNEIIFASNTTVGDFSLIDADCMGIAVGRASNQSVFKNLLFTDCTIKTDGSEIGMVAGRATNCTFTNCIANAGCQLWADGNGTPTSYAYAGGICGYADHSDFITCYNLATVMSDDNCIGGIVGYGTSTNITDCINAGVIKHATVDGFGTANREELSMTLLKTGSGLMTAATMSGFWLLQGSSWLAKGTDEASWWIRRLTVSAGKYAHAVALGTESVLWTYSIPVSVIVVALSVPEVLAGAGAVCMAGYALLDAYEVSTQPDDVGGIAGYMENISTITCCTNSGPLQCKDDECGGIVGYLKNSVVEHCYNRSFVKGCTNVGGIVGNCSGSCSIVANLNVGSVTSANNSDAIGEIVASASSDASVTSNYYLADVDETTTYGTGFTQEKLPSGWVALQLNNATEEHDIWCQNLGTDFYPEVNDDSKAIVTAVTDDYTIEQKIYTAGQFFMAVANPLAHINLQNDIDLGNYYFMLSTYAHPFKGIINGNGYTISNCKYESSSLDNKSVYSDAAGHDAALFPYATGAEFRDFTIDNFHITQKDETGKPLTNQALLVSTSSGCKYTNINVTNSDILINSDGDPKYVVAGLVALSNEDQITGCTVASSCTFQGSSNSTSVHDTNVAGIASKANGTTITLCHNAATIWGNDDYEAGIVSQANACTIDRCLNSGTITGQTGVAGIAGEVEATTITKCVNVGMIKDDESTKESHRAGIVGYMKTSGSISNCLNFGEVEYPGSNCGAIDGEHADAVTYGDGNNYYCQYDGANFTNLSTDLYQQVLTGAYAYTRDWLYQSIDNDPYVTSLPVPIPAAGIVLLDILCDGLTTVSYSNYYHGTQGHTTTAYAGICTTCGHRQSEVPQNITISDASDLKYLALAVQKGVNYSNSVIGFANDIDMSGVTDYMPIGFDSDYPFRGNVVGNSHRIKNLTLNRTNGLDGAGVFGCVSGTTNIWDLVVDSTCVITSNGIGTAGLVGCVTSPKGSTDAVYLTLYRCGNEAQVIGGTNTAGLVGGVFNNDNSSLSLYDCYNAGAIEGEKESAALVGYGRLKLNVKRCWNTGYTQGTDANATAVRYAKGATTVFANNYQANYLDVDTLFESRAGEDFCYGTICNLLNTVDPYAYAAPVWGQNLGTESLPQLVMSTGIRHERSMTRTWGTVVLPYAISTTDDYQLYAVKSCEISGSTGRLYLEPVASVEANTPCFFKKKDTSAESVCFPMGTNAFTLTEDDPQSITQATSATGWSIVGTYDRLTDLQGVYYVAQDKMWHADAAISVPAYRAYLTYADVVTECKSFSLSVLGEDGEVDEIVNLTPAESEGVWYNLAGQRVPSNAKGIVVSKGKKHVNR